MGCGDRLHNVPRRLRQCRQQRVEALAAAYRDPLREPRPARRVHQAVQVGAGREPVHPAVAHAADHQEGGFRRQRSVRVLPQQRQADHVAVALPLVDIGAPQRDHPALQHGPRIRVRHPGGKAAPVVVRRGHLVRLPCTGTARRSGLVCRGVHDHTWS
jgi:hypothetical protein